MSELRVLCVCTHNQTRSVMAAALAAHHLAEQGVPALVSSAGLRAGGAPATDETVRLLRARGLDVAGHRSRQIDDDVIGSADLIVTAEHEHVVQIAGRDPRRFPRTFTLPELVERGESHALAGRSLEQWFAAIAAERPTAFDYLDARVGEIADPTGGSRREWNDALALIDDLAARLAVLVAQHRLVDR